MTSSTNHKPLRLQLLFSAVLITATALVVSWLFDTPAEPVRHLPAQPPLVDTVIAESSTVTIPLEVHGLAEPLQQLTLVSQVVGSVTRISDQLVAGGSFSKGDILLEADSSYLDLELHKARSAYAQASLHEQEVQAHIDAGRQGHPELPLSDLALGKPQLEAASSARAAAHAALQVASKQRENAVVRAPFNGKVMARLIQPMEQLIVGRPLAQIYSTDAFLIRIALTQEQLALVSIPAGNSNTASTLLISNELSGQQWCGQLLRSEGFIAANRLIHVIGSITPCHSSLAEIIPGSLLQVNINSRPFANTIVLPASAVHNDNNVWIIDARQRLQRRTVSVLHRNNEDVYIGSGIQPGEQILADHLEGISENLSVRPRLAPQPAAQ